MSMRDSDEPLDAEVRTSTRPVRHSAVPAGSHFDPGGQVPRTTGCLSPLVIGLLLGLTGAGAALVAAWMLIPVQYTASAWLRVAESRPKIVFDLPPRDELEAWELDRAALTESLAAIDADLRDVAGSIARKQAPNADFQLQVDELEQLRRVTQPAWATSLNAGR